MSTTTTRVKTSELTILASQIRACGGKFRTHPHPSTGTAVLIFSVLPNIPLEKLLPLQDIPPNESTQLQLQRQSNISALAPSFNEEPAFNEKASSEPELEPPKPNIRLVEQVEALDKLIPELVNESIASDLIPDPAAQKSLDEAIPEQHRELIVQELLDEAIPEQHRELVAQAPVDEVVNHFVDELLPKNPEYEAVNQSERELLPQEPSDGLFPDRSSSSAAEYPVNKTAGMAALEDLTNLSQRRLKELATKYNISGRSNMKPYKLASSLVGLVAREEV